MEDGSQRIRRKEPSIDVLPDSVLDNIVSRYLDFPKAVRTGLVAKRWRHCWKFVNVIKFDHVFYEEFIEGTDHRLDAVANSILRRHIGPIRRFEIYVCHHGPNASFDIAEGVRILSDKKVEQLDVYVATVSHFDLPSDIYNFSSLVDLNLQHCKLGDMAIGFNGFPNLRSIRLSDVIVPDEFVSLIISNSPQLSQIDFEFRRDGKTVEIRQTAALVTNLDSIYYQCKERSTRLLCLSTCLPNLECAVLETELELPGCPWRTSRIDYLSSLLPCIKDLTLDDVALDSLVDDVVPRTLTSPFTYLDDLTLDIDLGSDTVLSLGFCIIRNAPMLRELAFHVYQENNVNIVPSMNVITQQLTLPLLERIETLSFGSLTGIDIELYFIKTVVKLCPFLRTVYFKSTGLSEEEEKELHDKLKGDIPLPGDASFEFMWDEREDDE